MYNILERVIAVKGYMKIGSVAKLFGLCSQTLRDYAESDVVIPERNDENRYRYYSRQEVTHLLKARYLKSMGFSLAEVLDQNLQCEHGKPGELSQKTMESDSLRLEDLIHRLNKREESLLEDIHRIERTRQEVENYRKQIESIDDYNNTYRIERFPQLLFLEISNEEDEITGDAEQLEEIRKWIAEFPCSRYAFMCRSRDMDDIKHNNGIRRGLCMDFKDVQRCGLNNRGRAEPVMSQTCIHTVVGINVYQNASAEMFRKAIGFINDHNMRIAGDYFGMWLANIRESDCVMKYFDVWIPIETIE